MLQLKPGLFVLHVAPPWDSAPFERCFADEPSAAEVEADVQAGLALGLQATPACNIGGKLLASAQPVGTFVEVLEGERR